jgi:hypothetical protein
MEPYIQHRYAALWQDGGKKRGSLLVWAGAVPAVGLMLAVTVLVVER